ncbi:uncharacterized protein G2W53_035555 [Senna tora]|uniref:Uncharacterized protein n=1 Tax=Senna tora TaxID=362788 RepID=A0A834SRV6_9FABA|nr:uncharacterized protein G2W53_035555 [Senna tora]
MAARAEEQECLNRTLASHLSTINDTIQLWGDESY